MPILRVVTNLPKERIPKNFVDKIIPTLSSTVKKPEDKFICIVSGDAFLHFHGDNKSPGAVASLESIGNLGPEENLVISKQVSEFVEKELGIKPERFLLSFYDLEPHNIGVQGTTAATMM